MATNWGFGGIANPVKFWSFREKKIFNCSHSRAYLRGGGFRGSNSPPREIFRFFLKSERKEVKEKREKTIRDEGKVNST